MYLNYELYISIFDCMQKKKIGGGTHNTTSFSPLSLLFLSSSKSSAGTAENQVPLSPPSAPATNMPRDEIKPLSGKPYFYVVISKSHLSSRYGLGPSGKMCQKLPFGEVPTVLNCRGKSWDMIYNGQNKMKQFDTIGWRNFAKDNNLKVGDACVFELMENSEEKIVFEVQILRGEYPGIEECEEEPIFISKFSGTGESGSPYVID